MLFVIRLSVRVLLSIQKPRSKEIVSWAGGRGKLPDARKG